MKLFKYISPLWLTLIGSSLLLSLWLAVFWFSLPSDQEILADCMTTKMFEVELCKKSPQYVPLSQIPDHFVHILILAEDASFWSHKGFDFYELEQSIKTNQKRGYWARGGSTITQQLAKNLFLTPEKTISRKIKEALITIRLEKLLSKKQILEKYINVVEFGPKVYGLKAASRFYFQKPPMALNPWESSFLVMLLPNPKAYSQSYFRKQLSPFATRRIESLIHKALRTGRLSTESLVSTYEELPEWMRASLTRPTTAANSPETSDEELEQELPDGDSSIESGE
ncbi:MAG: transglycosylase domain-containing protein [Bdellovibrionaceae bacterium]|jgi:monofunctional biosynthetic peptidoglycan transglycosylase|nr:transglycosylase domain-containing protein [Pseudobdellovibrionaceae bacterium]